VVFLRSGLAMIAKAVTASVRLFAFALYGSAGNNECPKRIHYGLLRRSRRLFPTLFPSRTVTLRIPTHAVVKILADNTAGKGEMNSAGRRSMQSHGPTRDMRRDKEWWPARASTVVVLAHSLVALAVTRRLDVRLFPSVLMAGPAWNRLPNFTSFGHGCDMNTPELNIPELRCGIASPSTARNK